MAGEPIDRRAFTEAEVQEILKRAVEEPPSRAVVTREGVTLPELRAIGEEVGIDPGRIDAAARAVALHVSTPSSRIVGASTRVDIERKVEGALRPEDAPEVLSAIRRATGLQGEVREAHGMLEWSATGDSGERVVTVSSQDGETTIRASANLGGAAVLTYLPAGVAGAAVSMIGLVTFLKEGSEIGLVLALVILPLLYPILRTIWSSVSASESDKLRRAVEAVAQLAEESEG